MINENIELRRCDTLNFTRYKDVEPTALNTITNAISTKITHQRCYAKKTFARSLLNNLYNYEAAEVIHRLENGKIQSELWSWNDSLMLIETLDEIRNQIGLKYESHDL